MLNYTNDVSNPTRLSNSDLNSDLVEINKTMHDISNISRQELINLVNQTTSKEELDALNSSARVRNLMQFSIPEGKLFYPEPFIASPSYLHSDLAFLHILHYWYWLWFLFIFLICFFFISFLCTVRWCQTRIKPRKETRGVSRSKCGDLITATVPVSWALSIIIQETTDATDLNDGFGTGELVVGVRAYQWGWEYYYPKTIDLNYNVKPSYSTFVGHSLKYNYSNQQHHSSNTFWRLYQNKIGDGVNTPTHLMLTPLDNANVLNFISFKNLGLNNLEASNAFPKIRKSSTFFKSNLVTSQNEFLAKYKSINSLFVGEYSNSDINNFGLTKQQNLITSNIINHAQSTFIDPISLNQYLQYAYNENSIKLTNFNFYKNWSNLTFENTTNLEMTNNVTKILNTNTDAIDTNVLSNTTSDWTYFKKLPLFSKNSKTSQLNHLLLNNNSFSRKTNLINSSLLNETSTDWNNNALENYMRISSDTFKQKTINNQEDKVLPNDQFNAFNASFSPLKPNANLSHSLDIYTSNSKLQNRLVGTNLFTTGLKSQKTSFVDLLLLANTASNRVFMSQIQNHSAIGSSNVDFNMINFDKQTTQKSQELFDQTTLTLTTHLKKSQAVDLLIGSRDKSPKSINSSYWLMFWGNTQPTHRLSKSLHNHLISNFFYMPTFTTYADYDFRNEQALEILEDLQWELSHSAYNFYDYSNINQEINKSTHQDPSLTGMDNYFKPYNMVCNETPSQTLVPNVRDLSLSGQFYPNSYQTENLYTNSKLMYNKNFEKLTSLYDLQDTEDSYLTLKDTITFVSQNAFNLKLNDNSFLTVLTSESVLNSFKSTLGTFTDFNTDSVSNSITVDPSTTLKDLNIGNVSRLSNLSTLRSSVKNSITNFNAFQKVFRSRFDENRAHVSANDYGDLALNQPFINDKKIPYLTLIGKNRSFFYEAPSYKNYLFTNFNLNSTLHEALTTPTYDFPFLLAATSDVIRHIWIDWASKWEYVEVQPASVSKYSTLGIPYMRKPFDFNSNMSDTLNDVESYFTKASRSRKNYISNWNYSSFIYNKNYVWNKLATETSLFNVNYATTHLRNSLSKMCWFWKLSFHTNTLYRQPTLALSNNDTYAHSTWRPRSSVQSYFYRTAHLVDLLSKREYMYRQYLENSKKIISLPVKLTATPNNPLLKDLQATFLFTDPLSYNNEYSRDVLTTSLTYYKYLYLKAILASSKQMLNSSPIKLDHVNNYIFFYFFNNSETNISKNLELYKNQYRPLRKGISNMLRLHGTGAIAMPVEMRLQILASSRDVIHSWSIPSAGIKIDCIPGYTSHRIMKFLLTGIYWGQCQEICGRYHHWMPIIAYFMKRDLFFLWCTHFVFNNTLQSDWNITDRKFADFIRFASYDKSSWLQEINHTL